GRVVYLAGQRLVLRQLDDVGRREIRDLEVELAGLDLQHRLGRLGSDREDDLRDVATRAELLVVVLVKDQDQLAGRRVGRDLERAARVVHLKRAVLDRLHRGADRDRAGGGQRGLVQERAISLAEVERDRGRGRR